MGSQAQKLRDLINSRKHFIACDVYSAITGRIVEKVGFKAAYLGGHACSAFHYAVPDIGVFSQVEQIEQAARIAAVIDIPLIVDADTLGETIPDAYHFTRRYEQAGIAGFHVEDEVNPKHSSYDNGLCSIADMQARLEACAKARRDPAFVIIARCDELYPSAAGGGGTGSLEEAIKRGRAYAEAGADSVTFPFAAPEVHKDLIDAIPIPVSVIGPTVPGTAFTMHTGWGWTSAARVHLQQARTLLETGHLDYDINFDHKSELIGADFYSELIGDWARKTKRKTRKL
jgi:2-methylisocitrate lyase-like PEP mutase family enzyme